MSVNKKNKRNISETPEHYKIKEKVKNNLEKWYKGITIKEYPNYGQVAYTYQISYEGHTILIEIIWTLTWTQFLEDLDILQNSLDFIKIVVVNPKMFDDNEEKKRKHFDKMRISEIRKGYIVSELINGLRILDDESYNMYLKEFIDFSLTLVSRNEKYTQIHHDDIKNFVIIPLLNKLDPQYFQHAEDIEINRILLKDMLDNHYVLIQEKFENYSNLPLEIKSIDNKIDNSIKKLVKSSINNNNKLLEVSIPNEYSSTTALYDTYKEKIVINTIVSKIKNSLETNNYTNIEDLDLENVDIVGTNEFIIYLRTKLQTNDISNLIYTSKEKANRDIIYKILKSILELFPTKTIRTLYKNKKTKELELGNVTEELKIELTKARFNTRLKFSRGTCDYI